MTGKDEQPQKKSPKRKRNRMVTLRLSDIEYEQIKTDAELLGITMGAYIRQVVLDAPIPRQSKRPSKEAKNLSSLLGHIGKIGSNINQIARAANSNIPYEKQSLMNELEGLKELRMDIKKSLGK